MNEYQKAFEHLIKHLETLQKFYVLDNGAFLKEDYEHDKSLIKELVERTVPKIAKEEYTPGCILPHYICPSCKKIMVDKAYSVPYCPICGQRIDWKNS